MTADRPTGRVTRRLHSRGPGWLIKLLCGIGLFMPGLLAEALEGRSAADGALTKPVELGKRYQIQAQPDPRVDCDSSGCRSSRPPLSDKFLQGLELDLQLSFSPSSADSTPIAFTHNTADPFVPPATGQVALIDGDLSPWQLEQLRQDFRDKCPGLKVTSISFRELIVVPASEGDQ